MKSLQLQQTLNKSACFSDIHFGRKNNSEIHNNDCLNYIQWFCENVSKDADIDHIVFLGDWFENRNAINVQTLNMAHKAMEKLNTLNLPIFFIVGNHDLYFRHLRNIYSVVIAKNFNNFIVIDEPIKINNILFLPFLFPHEYTELYSDINHAEIIYGHLELKGFVLTGETNILEHGPDHTDFNKPKRIFTGHFHKRQIKDNVIYIGNTFPMDFSDTNDSERGMMKYEYTSDKVEFIDWEESPKYIKTKLSELLDDHSSILTKNASVYCLADVDISLVESTDIREKFISEYQLREFTFEEPSSDDILEDTDMDLSGLELETTENIVVNLIKRIKDDSKIRNETLVEIYKGLK